MGERDESGNIASVPVVGVGSSVPVVPGSPVRGSSALSPGPTYRGPDPDPSLMVGPLSEFPDWPINDDWRDFAFEPVVFRVRPFFSESSLSERGHAPHSRSNLR